jgi:hypothetical protein
LIPVVQMMRLTQEGMAPMWTRRQTVPTHHPGNAEATYAGGDIASVDLRQRYQRVRSRTVMGRSRIEVCVIRTADPQTNRFPTSSEVVPV